MLLAVKSLDSCYEICVHVGGVKSELFTAGVVLQEGRVLSTLLFTVYSNGLQGFMFNRPPTTHDFSVVQNIILFLQ